MKIVNIRSKLCKLEQSLSSVILYHENNHTTFFKNNQKLEMFKQVRFAIRQAIQTIDDYEFESLNKGADYEINI